MVKTGACSLVLGRLHYRNFFPDREGKLMKIFKKTLKHDEYRHLHLVRKIRNYADYYCVPDELTFLINPSDNFYHYIQNLPIDKDLIGEALTCAYVDYGGQIDIFDTIENLLYKDFSIWKSHKSILDFAKSMLEGLYYLHQHKICHLDIKPENIIMNNITKRFKIIDFGCSSVEPFFDFINDLRGTPGYFPKQFKNFKPTNLLPIIEANDMIPVDGVLPVMRNPYFVYKIDSYCLGRVLYSIRYVYEDAVYFKIMFNKKSRTKLDTIIDMLTKNDVYERLTPKECLNLI